MVGFLLMTVQSRIAGNFVIIHKQHQWVFIFAQYLNKSMLNTINFLKWKDIGLNETSFTELCKLAEDNEENKVKKAS